MRRRKYKKQRKIMIASVIILLCIMTAGYAAFQTNLNITAKGNIKDIKNEVDSKVPTNELLFWGQAYNKDNTLNILKDKSGKNNNGIITGATFQNNILEFDGVDDYVNIGFANYDFNNSISYVIYLKINSLPGEVDLFSNFEYGGGGLYIVDKRFRNAIHDGKEYKKMISPTEIVINKYYTVIGTYDGINGKLYVDGILVSSLQITKLTTVNVPIIIGADSRPNAEVNDYFANMSLKETMLYDRALTDDEVISITNGFQLKYK